MDLLASWTSIFKSLSQVLADLLALCTQIIMVHPGAFVGARKEFLLGEKPAYAAGVEGGYARDALAVIQRRYFKRFPIDLPHDQEPTAEQLQNINDDEPEPENDAPDESKMNPDDYAAAVQAFQERQQLLQTRKAQIKRWLCYQYMKDHDIDSRDSGSQSSLRTLLSKLSNGKAGKPRLKTASNVWRRHHKDEIENETRRRAALAQTPRNKVAALRESVASELFAKANEAEKAQCKVVAEAEHKIAMEEWKASLNGKFSLRPEDRQRAIDGLASFMRPILEGVCEATGWKASLTMGGPEPAMGGRLNTLSLHTGHAPGDIKMTYGRAEHATFKKYTLPSFGRFLRTCYSIEECRACALPNGELQERPEPTEDDPNITLFQIDPLDTELPSSGPNTAAEKILEDASSNGVLAMIDSSASGDTPQPKPTTAAEKTLEHASSNGLLPMNNSSVHDSSVPGDNPQPGKDPTESEPPRGDDADLTSPVVPTAPSLQASEPEEHPRPASPPPLLGDATPPPSPRGRTGLEAVPRVAASSPPFVDRMDIDEPSFAVTHPHAMDMGDSPQAVPSPNVDSNSASPASPPSTQQANNASPPIQRPNPSAKPVSAPGSATPTPRSSMSISNNMSDSPPDQDDTIIVPPSSTFFIDDQSSSSSSSSHDSDSPPPESSPPSTVSGSPPPDPDFGGPRRSKRHREGLPTASAPVSRPAKRSRPSVAVRGTPSQPVDTTPSKPPESFGLFR